MIDGLKSSASLDVDIMFRLSIQLYIGKAGKHRLHYMDIYKSLSFFSIKNIDCKSEHAFQTREGARFLLCRGITLKSSMLKEQLEKVEKLSYIVTTKWL